MNVVRQQDFFEAGPGGEGPAFAWLPVLMSFLHRRWRTVAGWVAVFVVLAIAYIVVATPKYTASVELLIDTRQASAFRQQANGGNSDPQAENAIVESQVEVLRSEGLARAVVEKLDLANDQQFRAWGFSLPGMVIGTLSSLVEPPSTRQPGPNDGVSRAVEELQRMVAVRRIGLSNVLQIDVLTPDAGRSAQFANALSTTYIDSLLGAKYDITRQASSWLQDRLKELRDQSIGADQALQTLKAKVGLLDTDKGGFNEQQLGDLSLQLSNARARVAETTSRYARIQAITATGVTSASSGSVSDALQNTVILKLQQQYLDDGRKLAEWTVKYGPTHVAVVGVRNEMSELQRAIGGELNRIQEAYKSDADVARANEAAVQKQIDGLVAVSTAANNQRVQVRALESLSDTYRTLYGSFLQRYTQAAQDQSFPISEARVITAASVPLRKSRPQTLLILLGSVVVGAAAGVGMGFLKEVTDRRIQTPQQLRALTGLDVLGLLPVLNRTDVTRGARQPDRRAAGARILPGRPGILRWVVDQPLSPFSEVIRGLRVRVSSQRNRSRPIRVIGIVSAATGEGKTVVAANLAQALASGGQRTLLVDADLRTRQLTQWWASGRTAGLEDVVAGRASLEDAVWRDSQSGLFFLPASAGGKGHAADILGTPAARDVLAGLGSGFDLVVLDLACLNTADAHSVGNLVDGFIVVVEWAETDENALVDALTAADLDGSRLLGTVMNKVDLKAVRRQNQGSGQSYRAFSTQLAGN